MTTRRTHFDSVNRRLAARLPHVVRFEKEAIENFGYSVLLALPLMLLAADGPLFLFGIAYAVAYGITMLIPTALHVLSGYDALRVLVRRNPLFVPYLMAVGKVGEKTAVARPRASRIAEIALTGNPLSTVTRELWIFAFRFNRKAVEGLSAEADRIAQQLNEPGGLGSTLIAAEVQAVPGRPNDLALVLSC